MNLNLSAKKYIFKLALHLVWPTTNMPPDCEEERFGFLLPWKMHLINRYNTVASQGNCRRPSLEFQPCNSDNDILLARVKSKFDQSQRDV